MADRPRDLTDLYLAPVLLAIDARIEELGKLGKSDLVYEVALETNSLDNTRELREEALIRALTHLTETHHWKLSWDPRGLRLAHDEHTFVLGVPAVFRDYLENGPAR